jgi:hypothetical protein
MSLNKHVSILYLERILPRFGDILVEHKTPRQGISLIDVEIVLQHLLIKAFDIVQPIFSPPFLFPLRGFKFTIRSRLF